MLDEEVQKLVRALRPYFPPGIAGAYRNGLYRAVRELRYLGASLPKLRAAMRSREAIQLGRFVQAGARGVPPFFAQLGRLAYAIARVAGRHPLILLFFLLLTTGLYVYGSTMAPIQVAKLDVPNCDCTKVEWGLLTKQYQDRCRSREKELRQLAAGCGGSVSCVKEKLNLKVGADSKFISGEFCDPTDLAAGPEAWPELGGAAVPPAVVLEKKPCKSATGISRACGK
jgi:hypothetical protein